MDFAALFDDLEASFSERLEGQGAGRDPWIGSRIALEHQGIGRLRGILLEIGSDFLLLEPDARHMAAKDTKASILAIPLGCILGLQRLGESPRSTVPAGFSQPPPDVAGYAHEVMPGSFAAVTEHFTGLLGEEDAGARLELWAWIAGVWQRAAVSETPAPTSHWFPVIGAVGAVPDSLAEQSAVKWVPLAGCGALRLQLVDN